MHRRHFCSSLLASLSLGCSGLALVSGLPAAAQEAVSGRLTTEDLRSLVLERARALAQAPWAPTEDGLSPGLASLDYDAYRRIAFRNERSLWRDGPFGFEIQPLHRGFIQTAMMQLTLVEDGIGRRLAYDANLFSFGGETPPAVSDGDIGYSGVRVLAHVGENDIAREFLVFQGASYFRAIPPGLVYGLSARGIAVRTGDPAGEEFPAFTELWIERPVPGSTEMVVHALLDGPSLTGAFRFVVTPGLGKTKTTGTRMQVSVTLFPRVDLLHVGLAPLTSMYHHAPLEHRGVDDYRPRVHDSDGLQILMADGQEIWRPLANPATLQASSFLPGPGGIARSFGLAQRERSWTSYQDAEADYERRPGCRVEPGAGWPRGRVELIEIPTGNEYADNIVAYWRPEIPLRAGSEVALDYTLVWSGDISVATGLMRVDSSASGAAAWPRDRRRVVIDFVPLPGGDPVEDRLEEFEPHLEATGGAVESATLAYVEESGALRLSFLVEMQSATTELRALIRRNGRTASETWLYRMTEE